MTPLRPDQIEALSQQLPGCLLNEPMSKHTNFRIGGPARLYDVAHGIDALLQAIKAATDANIPWSVFGGGSNLLVADAGYEGLIIQSALRGLSVDGQSLYAESGVITALAARKAADASLTGFEWAIGVPGTIGGAVYGNAGCYGGEMKDVITSIDAFRITDGQRVAYSNADCHFTYRESRFKKERHVVLSCTLALQPGNADASKKRMQEIVDLRKLKQPLELSSAGCAFKNFEYQDEEQIAKLRQHADIPEEMLQQKTISAGWLVDQADARGMKIGAISVSDKHGNFLVNNGGGRADEVIQLVSLVKTKIRDTFGIQLENEVQLLGFE